MLDRVWANFHFFVLFCFRLENRTLSTLKLEELACLPQVEPAALVTDSVAGANVSLRCSVFGLPSASVSWWHSNRLVANGSELQHAWEDQYYSIGEYRTNDHQVRSDTAPFLSQNKNEHSVQFLSTGLC